MNLPKLWSDETEARVREAARDLDAQQRPDTVEFCTRCVISNQRPRITFDDEGVCSACRYAERKAKQPHRPGCARSSAPARARARPR